MKQSPKTNPNPKSPLINLNGAIKTKPVKTNLQKLRNTYRHISIVGAIMLTLMFLLLSLATHEFYTTPLFGGDHPWLGIFIMFIFVSVPINIICLINLGNLRVEPEITKLENYHPRTISLILWTPIAFAIYWILFFFINSI